MNSCSRVASTNVAVIITQDDVSTQFCTFEFDQNELVVCLFVRYGVLKFWLSCMPTWGHVQQSTVPLEQLLNFVCNQKKSSVDFDYVNVICH